MSGVDPKVAEALLLAYQERHVRSAARMSRYLSDASLQAYMNWRTAWLVECLNHMPSWGREYHARRAQNLVDHYYAPGI